MYLIDPGIYLRLEFEGLIEKHSHELEDIQRSYLLTYLRVAAYAEEYRSFWVGYYFSSFVKFAHWKKNIFLRE